MEWGQQQQETQLEGHISKEGWGVDSSLLVLVNEDISVMLQNRFDCLTYWDLISTHALKLKGIKVFLTLF